MDDSSLQCDILRQQLASWGLECQTFSSGKEALEGLLHASWSGKPFGLAILDWAMPGMNGMELARAIRAQPAITNLSLLMLTSFEASLSTEELTRAGFKGLLTKPLRQSRLLNAIIDATGSGKREATMDKDRAPDFKEHTETSSRSIQGDSQTVSRSQVRILLAEDNEVNQMVASELLAKAGYNCRIVSDGRLALECIQAEQFDIVLMDCQMPQMDGFEATTAIREFERAQSRQPVTIIALTANAIKGDQERCLAAGMDAYLTKPLNPVKLIQTVEVASTGRVNRNAAVAPSGSNEENRTVEKKISEPNINNTPRAIRPEDMPSVDQPIDAQALLDRCVGDMAFLETILDKFQAQSVEYIREVLRDAQRRDAPALARAGHVLRGMAANLSAVDLQAAAARLEEHAQTGDLDRIQNAVQELQQQLARCLNDIPRVVQWVKSEVRET